MALSVLVGPFDQPDYILYVDVLDYRDVRPQDRFQVGGEAGQARIAMRLSVLNSRIGAVIGRVVARGQTARGWTIFDGSTQGAIDQAAIQLANYVSGG